MGLDRTSSKEFKTGAHIAMQTLKWNAQGKRTRRAIKHVTWKSGGGDGIREIYIVSVREDGPKSIQLQLYNK